MTIEEIENMARAMIIGQMPPAKREPLDYGHTWVAIRLSVPIAIEVERERCAKTIGHQENDGEANDDLIVPCHLRLTTNCVAATSQAQPPKVATKLP